MLKELSYHDTAIAFTYIVTGFALGATFVAKYVYQPMLRKSWEKFMAEEIPEVLFKDLYPLDEIDDTYKHPDDIKLTNYVSVTTPDGVVFLRYNKEEEGFEYWSKTKTLQYEYLETCARKYINFFNCKNIYVDRRKNIEENKKRIEESNQKQEEGRENNEEQEEEDDIFVKTNTNKVTKKAIDTNNLAATKANKYIYKGDFQDFSKESINITMVENKSQKMTFADFKKLLSI